MAINKSNDERELKELIGSIGKNPDAHGPGGELYRKWDKRRGELINILFRATVDRVEGVQFGEFGRLIFPFHSMGAISSLDLFGLDELILFEFYRINRDRYRRAVDIGANIGLHSIVMSLCGMNVNSYEPDPEHIKILEENLRRNQIIDQVHLHEKAVSGHAGTSKFVRVLGNTTGSHLKDAKAGAYGELEEFDVTVSGIREILKGVDLAKIDAEGEEAEILLATKEDDWDSLDAVIEVGSCENAVAIFRHFSSMPVNLMVQKNGWAYAESPEHLPQSYREGSLFVSKKQTMPW